MPARATGPGPDLVRDGSILAGMDLGVIFAIVGALVAGVFTFQLAQQYAAKRRHHALAWALALGCYAVGMLAQAVGFSAGWSPVTYAVYWLAGALLSVALLAIGQLHLLDPARAALWWTLGGLAVVWAVGTMLVSPYDTQVLAEATAAGSIPTGKDVFEEGLAYSILRPITMIGALVVLGGCLWSGIRSRRYGILLIALGVFVSATSTAFQRQGYDEAVALVLAVGVAIMYLGFRAAGKAPRPRRGAEADATASAAG
jgi:hypothetical protein